MLVQRDGQVQARVNITSVYSWEIDIAMYVVRRRAEIDRCARKVNHHLRGHGPGPGAGVGNLGHTTLPLFLLSTLTPTLVRRGNQSVSKKNLNYVQYTYSVYTHIQRFCGNEVKARRTRNFKEVN